MATTDTTRTSDACRAKGHDVDHRGYCDTCRADAARRRVVVSGSR